MPVFASGFTPNVTPRALWSWNTTASGIIAPTVSGFPSSNTSGVFTPTKTGLMPIDLQSFIGVPLQYYNTNPPTPVAANVQLEWLRYAEDKIEQETSILLCQTWVASPPALPPQAAVATGLNVTDPSKGQQQGIDYDLEDSAYDFQFARAQDEGWMYYTLRYRPVRSVNYTASDFTAIKNVSYIYPLLNEFFRVPPTWIVEDRDFGLMRLVPAANVQMLPLFAMQLAFMGFSESVPGALWLQYTAGLTPNDYATRFRFMRELVLAEAALTALNSIHGTINLGIEVQLTQVDGLQYRSQFSKEGPYGPLIMQFTKRRDSLMKIAQSKVSGPMVNFI